VIQAASGVSGKCVSSLQLVLRAFGESGVARSLPAYGWGNVLAVDLRMPLGVLGADVTANYYGSTDAQNVLFGTRNSRMKVTADPQCQRAEVLYTAFIDYIGKGAYRTDSVYRPRAVTSSVVVDLRSLTDVGSERFGLAKLSEICHEVVDQGTVRRRCSPEKLDVYCQFDRCFAEPIEELVAHGKIRSGYMPRELRLQVLDAELKARTLQENE
jgi:hypothetical protein